ncbi:hypothetical protein [Paenibacillus sp. DYY-L-2]|uniref:hypothetical protein n=1 Tax=Paenibacillus sp. DYY-L-2 TaxID=3447013 RepID=UPI003F4FF7D2
MKKIILGATAACFLLSLLIFGTILYKIGFFKDDTSRALIPYTDIPKVLHVEAMPRLPEWEVERIQEYDDHFTSPTCTVYFTNGIELLISTSPVSFSGKEPDESPIQYQDGPFYYSLKPQKEQDHEVIESYLKTLQAEAHRF